MVSALCRILALRFSRSVARRRARRSRPSPPSTAELWPDAQAKGITRATFDLAMRGVTPDPRVIAATKRQPEYGKPVGDYVNDIVSRGRIANGQRKAKEWAKTFDAVEKEIRRRTLGAGRAVGHGDRLRRREGPLGRVPLAGDARLRALPPSVFPQRIDRRDAHHAGRPLRARQDGQLMGRRHGPDPVHADQRRRLRHRFFRRRQERHLEQCAGRARLDRQLSAQGALEVRPALGLRGQRAEGLRLHEEPRQLRGMEKARRAPRRRQAVSARQATAFCSFPAAPTARPSSSRKIIDVLKEYNNSDAYAIAVGHLADRMQGRRRRSRPPGRPTTVRCRATRASPCRRNWRRSATRCIDFEGHVDFDLRDNIRAEQKKLGMLPDGNPTAAFLEKLGVQA